MAGGRDGSDRRRGAMNDGARTPEWVIRQGFACVWVRAANAEEAMELAARKLGHMGGWRVGPDVEQEVFAADEYREYAEPGDYTRSVIFDPRSA